MEQTITPTAKESFWKITKFKIITSIAILLLYPLSYLMLGVCFAVGSGLCDLAGFLVLPLFYFFFAPGNILQALIHPSYGYRSDEKAIKNFLEISSFLLNTIFAILISYFLACLISKLITRTKEYMGI